MDLISLFLADTAYMSGGSSPEAGLTDAAAQEELELVDAFFTEVEDFENRTARPRPETPGSLQEGTEAVKDEVREIVRRAVFDFFSNFR